MVCGQGWSGTMPPVTLTWALQAFLWVVITTGNTHANSQLKQDQSVHAMEKRGKRTGPEKGAPSLKQVALLEVAVVGTSVHRGVVVDESLLLCSGAGEPVGVGRGLAHKEPHKEGVGRDRVR